MIHLKVQIPAGIVQVGSARPGESPPTKLCVASFHIDRFAVDNKRFAEFIAAGGYTNPIWWSAEGWRWVVKINVQTPAFWHDGRFNHDLQPALVSAHESEAYAKFVGGSLPTEIQFERAARGDDERRFPWGDLNPTEEHANFAPSFCPMARAPEPVDACPLGDSPFGCRQMAGNVHEWTRDAFQFDTPARRHAGDFVENRPSARRVLKGGAWTTDETRLWISARWSYQPGLRDNVVGFRVVYPL